MEEKESKNTRLKKVPRCDSPGMDSLARDTNFTVTLESPKKSLSNTIKGKLKALCPYFFHSLMS